MNLDPLAIALQGVGFGPSLMAVQGFGFVDDEPETPGRGWRSVPRIKRKEPKVRRDKDDDVLLAFLLN